MADQTSVKPLPLVAPDRWQAIAIVDDVDTCNCCGKTGLKRTVVMRAEQGGEEFYFGTSCAATHTGRPTHKIVSEARRAEATRREAADAERRRLARNRDQAEATANGFSDDNDGVNAYIDARATVRFRAKDPSSVRSSRAAIAWSQPRQLAAWDAYLTRHGIALPDIPPR
jgi:hypothetical protein